MSTRRHLARPCAAALALSLTAIAIVLAPAFASAQRLQPKWSLQYLIEDNRTPFPHMKGGSPRDCRGLAVSPDMRYLYAGYNTSDNIGEVRKIDLTQPDFYRATVRRLTGQRAKDIACDDVGRVYLASGTSIKVYDADLRYRMYTINMQKCEGVAVVREGDELVLYASDRADKTLSRFVMFEKQTRITGHARRGLGEAGIYKLPNAKSLRGLAVDPKSGDIWVADHGDRLHKINMKTNTYSSLPVEKPLDVALFDQYVIVTQYTRRAVQVLDRDLKYAPFTLIPPWNQLGLDPDGQDRTGALSGIAVLDGRGLFIANEGGQTANSTSIYNGRNDGEDPHRKKDAMPRENSKHKRFKASGDDNEPILYVELKFAETEASARGDGAKTSPKVEESKAKVEDSKALSKRDR